MTTITRQRLQYIITDILTGNVGWLVFNVARYYSLPPGYETRSLQQWLLGDPNVLLGQLLVPLAMAGLYALSGFYNSPGVKSRLDITGNTLLISFIGTIGIFFIALINDNVPERLQNYELMAILWMMLALPCLAGRLSVNGRRVAERRRGIGLIRAVIYGTPGSARDMGRRLTSPDGTSDYEITGRAATLAELNRLIKETEPQAIILSENNSSLAENTALISSLYTTGPDIYVPAGLYQLLAAKQRVTQVKQEPLINITRAHIPPSTANLKRVGDVIVSAVALILLSPVLAALAIAVRRDSPGPAFYTQERIGYRKKIFRIVKLRTMRTDAEQSGPALASADDPRVTRVGRVLRKYRLDELPQFWNVLRGDMSLVGPRPERRHYADMILQRAPHYSLIHQVRPGITSWGMVKYGYAGSVDQMLERLRYDMIYLENVSMGVDIKILFYTVRTVLTGKGV